MRLKRFATGSVILLITSAMSVPVFAVTNPPAKEPTPLLTIDYVSKATQNGESTVKVSGLVVPPSGKTYYVGFRYNKPDSSEGDDSGRQIPKTFTVSSSTQVFSVTIPPGAKNLDVAEYSSPSDNGGEHDGDEIAQESAWAGLNKLPYGNLPEAPWAAGLPLVAVGLAGWWYKFRAKPTH